MPGSRVGAEGGGGMLGRVRALLCCKSTSAELRRAAVAPEELEEARMVSACASAPPSCRHELN